MLHEQKAQSAIILGKSGNCFACGEGLGRASPLAGNKADSSATVGKRCNLILVESTRLGWGTKMSQQCTGQGAIDSLPQIKHMLRH